MGGGGAMQHAVDANKANKAQKQHRRSRFNGNHGDETILDIHHKTLLDFSHLSEQEIVDYRTKLNVRYKRNRIFFAITYILAAFVTAFLIYYVVNSFLPDSIF